MFKIGDKVKVTFDGKHLGIGTIVSYSDDMYLVDLGEGFDGHTGGGQLTATTGWWCLPHRLTLLTSDVEIVQHGLVVIAKRGENEGIARCNPADEFDLKTGIDLALQRLEEKEKYGKPFVPETNERIYYTARLKGSLTMDTIFVEDYFTDALMVALKAVYRTEKEAEEHADEIHAKMQKVLDYAKSL